MARVDSDGRSIASIDDHSFAAVKAKAKVKARKVKAKEKVSTIMVKTTVVGTTTHRLPTLPPSHTPDGTAEDYYGKGKKGGSGQGKKGKKKGKKYK